MQGLTRLPELMCCLRRESSLGGEMRGGQDERKEESNDAEEVGKIEGKRRANMVAYHCQEVLKLECI